MPRGRRSTRIGPPTTGPGRRSRITSAAAAAAESTTRSGFGGSRLTRQIAVLGVVLAVVALSLAYPLQNYLSQRADLAAAVAQQHQLDQRIAELQIQQAALADPHYIAGEAKRRLQYVKPGDTVYVVQAPPLSSADAAAPQVATAGRPLVQHAVEHPRPRTRDRRRSHRARCSGPRAAPAGRGPLRGADRMSGHIPRGRVREPATDVDVAALTAELGRPPRGVHAVAYRCAHDIPAVVQTAPRLPDGSPFPTLYYLCCSVLNSAVGRMEGEGLMAGMTDRLAEDADLAAAYLAAHEAYLAERDALGDLGITVSAGGMPTRVKCLHVLVAHALAAGPGVNPLGDEAIALLPQYSRGVPCVPVGDPGRLGDGAAVG